MCNANQLPKFPSIGFLCFVFHVFKNWPNVSFLSVAQSYLSLCNPMDYSPQASSDHGISQARVLEWVAISPSKGSSPSKDRTHSSCISALAGWFFTTAPPGKPQCFLSLMLHVTFNWRFSYLTPICLHNNNSNKNDPTLPFRFCVSFYS